MTMDFDEITRILEMMREHELSEFELERDNLKLRIRKHGNHAVQAAVPAHHVPAVSAGAPASPLVPAGTAGPALTAAEEDVELVIVISPIVGTFYRSAEPGARAFAEVGDRVKAGQALCIIEAMKLMNEIDAEVDGEVVKVYVENGQAVQYGERLFALRPA